MDVVYDLLNDEEKTNRPIILTLLFDRSASMKIDSEIDQMHQDVIVNYLRIISEKLKNEEVYLTSACFNDQLQITYQGSLVDQNETPLYKIVNHYYPQSQSLLYDSIIKLIGEFEKDLKIIMNSKVNLTVIFVIFIGGEDTLSKASLADVRKRIQATRKNNWEWILIRYKNTKHTAAEFGMGEQNDFPFDFTNKNTIIKSTNQLAIVTASKALLT